MKVGFLGTGLMGQPMVGRLLEAQLSVMAYNRTPSKLEPLRKSGAEISDSPAEVIQASDCIILMLADATAINEVLLSESSRSLLSGRTVIQMGTIAPSESQKIRDAVIAAGGDYLEATVLGSVPQAKKGELQMMVGASQQQFQKWSELLKHFGSEPLLIGPVGTAAAMKLALNQLIASLTSAFALSLGFVQREGVETDKFMEILRQSALYAPTFDKKLDRMSDRNYASPNFPTQHLLKDTDLFLSQASAAGLDVSNLEGVRHIIQKAQDLGFSESDYAAIFSAINPQE